MGAVEVTAFINHLAVNRKVAASTQSQALDAIVFLYEHVLGRLLGQLQGLNRGSLLPLTTVIELAATRS